MLEKQRDQYDTGSTGLIFLLWLGVLCVGLLFYGWTVQHGVAWQDSGARQLRILTGDYTGSLGLALAHPLYIAIGRVFLLMPYVSDFTLLNYCSGFGMAITLANVSILGWMLSGRRWIGLMSAGMLSVMYAPWWLSTIAEVYTWNAAFFSAELILFVSCIRKPSLLKVTGLFLLNGLNVGVHNMALLSLPVYGISLLAHVWRRQLSPVSIVFSLAAYICGALPLVWLVMQETLQTGSLQASIESMLFGRYAGEVLNLSFGHSLMLVNAALSSLNFLHPGLILGVFGWVTMFKRIGRPLAWPLLILISLHGLFFLRYSVPDQFMFILPTLVLFSLSMAIGMDVLARRSAAMRKIIIAVCLFSIVLMPLTYAALPPALRALNLDVKRARVLPFRDEMRYWIVPWKHNEHSAEEFARVALSEAAPDGVIVCDSTSYYPLVLMKERMSGVEGISIEGYTTMVSRYSEDPLILKQTLQEHSVFLVSPIFNFISKEHRQAFEIIKEPEAVLYRLQLKIQEGR